MRGLALPEELVSGESVEGRCSRLPGASHLFLLGSRWQVIDAVVVARAAKLKIIHMHFSWSYSRWLIHCAVHAFYLYNVVFNVVSRHSFSHFVLESINHHFKPNKMLSSL